MTTRATTSASNLFRRALCPGSERMERGLPDEESEDAKEGTLLHLYDANPNLDRSVLKPEQRDLLRISAALDVFVFERAIQEFRLVEPHQHHREIELNYLDVVGHPDLLEYYLKDKTAIVIDKKFGRRPQVTASLNKQLRAYAVMAAERVTCERVVVAITQPRAPFVQRITMAVYTQEDIVAARAEIDEILRVARDPFTQKQLNAGDEQCRYCKAKIKCPAYAENLVEDGNAMLSLKHNLDLATPLQISRLLRAIQFADFIKDQVRDIARKMVAEGRLEGWSLGAASSYRKIMDPARAIALLQLRGDLSRDEILDCSAPSLTKLRDKLRDKLGCTWKEANAIIDDTLAGVIEEQEKRAPLSPINK